MFAGACRTGPDDPKTTKETRACVELRLPHDSRAVSALSRFYPADLNEMRMCSVTGAAKTRETYAEQGKRPHSHPLGCEIGREDPSSQEMSDRQSLEETFRLLPSRFQPLLPEPDPFQGCPWKPSARAFFSSWLPSFSALRSPSDVSQNHN